MPLNTKKLVQLLEQAGPDQYRQSWREQLGLYVKEDPNTHCKRPAFDASKGSINPRNVSLLELDMAFGEHVGYMGSAGRYSFTEWRLQEGAVLPSTFAHISGFDQTIAGLLDALMLEAYQRPQFVGKEMIGTEEWRVNGGKQIRAANDGQLSDEIQVGTELPYVGMKENWITLPVNERRGNQIAIDQLDYVYDRTGLIQERATNAGEAVAWMVERRIARVVLGIVNPFYMNDTACNTYKASAAAAPHAFINWADNTLVDWNNLNTSYVAMQSNTDPNTGFTISVPTPKLYCSPHKYLHTRSIIFPTQVREYSASIGAASTQTLYENPLGVLGVGTVEALPMQWYNILVEAAATGGGAYTAANAQKMYLLGDPSRAFKWKQVLPFASRQLPLTGTDMAKGIAQRFMCEEVGVPVVREPRYIFQSGDTTPTS
jgi:hypothetical protein